MKFFITGTNTNIGKTLVSSWICAHTGYDYFKPIQSGGLGVGDIDETDSSIVKTLANVKIHPEEYIFSAPLSPHIASKMENINIDMAKINLPDSQNLLVEGAGGALVPINNDFNMSDLMKQLNIPVIIVSSTLLGTINHTLLTIEALRSRSIDIAGVVMSGEENLDNFDSIENYGKVEILGHLPLVSKINKKALLDVDLSSKLRSLLIQVEAIKK